MTEHKLHPATLQPRDTAWERLTRAPFVLDNAKSQHCGGRHAARSGR